MRSSMAWYAASPIAANGCRTVVSRTRNSSAYFTSSIPPIMTSSGTRTPKFIERMQQVAGRHVVAADDAIGLLLAQHLANVGRVARIAFVNHLHVEWRRGA